MKKMIIGLIVFILGVSGFWGYKQLTKPANPEADQLSDLEAEGFNKSMFSIDEPGSQWWIINKQRPLPEGYVPPQMIAPDIKLRWASDAESMQVSVQIAEPLEDLYKAAKQAEVELMLVSGYRSEAYQKELYDNYVRQSGQKAADRFSAKPGTSEHQTGLAVDMGRADGKCEFEECFGETKEGEWLADNAQDFGFIVHYLKGKEEITGYQYEPWHLRYVGKELAAELYESGQTMEEFFNL